MSNDNLNNMVNGAIDTLSLFEMNDIQQLDSDTLDRAEEQLRFFMSCIRTVAAKKRAEKIVAEETKEYLDKMEAIIAARNNANADCSSFDKLSDNEKKPLLNLASLANFAIKKNDIVTAEKIKCTLMGLLADHNLGNKIVMAHVMNVAS